MTDTLTDVDTVLLNRWTDAVSFREAMSELEGRLGARLDAAAESLRPWLEESGYAFQEVEAKYARINVARSTWLTKKNQPWVWFTLDALLPYGYRKVQDEHPLVRVDSRNLDKDDRSRFQDHLTHRLTGRAGGWLNEDCTRDHPAGRHIASHGDRERVTLAQTPDALALFIRQELTPILALGDDVEAALRATIGK